MFDGFARCPRKRRRKRPLAGDSRWDPKGPLLADFDQQAPDLLVAKGGIALGPIFLAALAKFGGQGRNRTTDTRIFSPAAASIDTNLH
jgi:hypothetical protein